MMKQVQGTWLRGYITIQVIGYHPELFFDLCTRHEIDVWQIKKVDQTTCVGNIFIKDIIKTKQIRKQTRYKLRFVRKTGLPFAWKKVNKRKPLLIGFIVSLFFITLLSNMVWKIEVAGVRPEIEKQIRTTLSENGVYPGMLKFSIDSPSNLQKKILDNIPELLWVGVTEKGTTYSLEGVEKTSVSEQESRGPSNIVAAKDGVIVDMYVAKGKPMASVNDYVKKGDILVAGDLSNTDSEDDDEEKTHNKIAVEAEIYANTWYESTITVPLQANYKVLTGNVNRKYYLNLADLNLPIWGFFQETYKEEQVEVEQKSIHFFQWELPISFVKKSIFESEQITEKRSRKNAREVGIKQAKTQLQQTLGHEAEITNEKILHEASENGKVKLDLYFTVKENIVKIQDLSQGD
ncbi:sporulation protein YqfD [Paraliobacillus quinghaiensis]|nr:sporulation protein YqfD [Paraliobacillus quinghaiensis]